MGISKIQKSVLILAGITALILAFQNCTKSPRSNGKNSLASFSGGNGTEDYAFHIRILANQLVFKTSSSDKLAGEAFVFASEIAPPKAVKARSSHAITSPDSPDSD